MPDPVTLRVPKLSLGITHVTFIRWLVDDGATVDDGEALYEVETDKVETEVPAPAAGRLHQRAEPGAEYAVGAEIGTITS